MTDDDSFAVMRPSYGQPVALMLLGVLHCIPDEDDPHAVVAGLLAPVPPGSYLAVAHPASDIAADQMARSSRDYNQQAAARVTMRTHAEVSRFFDGLGLVEPGVVQLHQWRPGAGDLPQGRELANYGGVGRKRRHPGKRRRAGPSDRRHREPRQAAGACPPAPGIFEAAEPGTAKTPRTRPDQPDVTSRLVTGRPRTRCALSADLGGC